VRQLLWALGMVALGLLAVALDRWRAGSELVGVAFCLAAAARLMLPEARVGELAVRSRVLDATVLLVIGFGIVGLANSIPGHG
jgi:hypothetical protein